MSSSQIILDTVQALGADIEGEEGKSDSALEKLGNIQFTLHLGLNHNRNLIKQDSFKARD